MTAATQEREPGAHREVARTDSRLAPAPDAPGDVGAEAEQRR